MIQFFNEIMDSLKLFVHCYFNDLEFVDGVSVGWLLLSITIFAIIIKFLYGRTK